MIALDRGNEPAKLTEQRRWRLASQNAARHFGMTLPPIDGYDVVREELQALQNCLCAYCGERLRLAGLPVEHFRPKQEVDRRKSLADKEEVDDGYWWLSWTWENLLFSCSTCNTGHKGIHFPIQGRRLGTNIFDLKQERSVFLDPSFEDPMDAIEWRPTNDWMWHNLPPDKAITYLCWKPVHKNRRGKKTIEFLHFSGELSDIVTGHIRDMVWRSIRDIRQMMMQGQQTQAQQEWNVIYSSLFGRYKPFPAATYNAIQFLFPEAISVLGLRRPGPQSFPKRMPQGLPTPPDGVSQTLWWSILACHSKTAITAKETLLLELFIGHDWTFNQVLERFPILSKANLQTYLSRLVQRGDLRKTSNIYSTP